MNAVGFNALSERLEVLRESVSDASPRGGVEWEASRREIEEI